MKRIGNLYEKIIDKENLRRAHHNARKGKGHYREVKQVNTNEQYYINKIHDMLKNKTFKNAEYKVFQRKSSGKIRTIYKLPYYPDRIIQHAILQVMEPIWKRILIRDTYQSIKKRGVHDAKRRVEQVIRKERPPYCLKIDIKKFYPSVDNEILKSIVRKKIKCPDTLWLLDEIIDSTQGLPIGNYISQYFGNLYLAYFDHWIKEYHAKLYFRYADDIVIFHHSKTHLQQVLRAIQAYLKENLNLNLKENYQVFPVAARPVDFLGYVFHYNHTLVRKSIKEAFIRKALKYQKKPTAALRRSLASYYGWLVHCNSYNLQTKYLNNDLFGSTKKQERAA
jgi:retron-type reverse transcriptase